MKKSIFLSSVLTIGILLFGMRTASAIAIDISPASFDTTGLATVSSTVSITGLTAANEIVSAYDFDILYDAALLGVNNVAFASLDGFPSLGFALDDFIGTLNVSDLSFDSDAFLDSVQGDTVELFTVTFDVFADGLTDISASFDPSIPTCVVGKNAACLNLTSVPEPSIIALLGLGIAGMGFARRRKI